jgi:hypothetical protein
MGTNDLKAGNLALTRTMDSIRRDPHVVKEQT